MALNLQIKDSLSTVAQPIKDQDGNTSLVVLSENWAGIGKDPGFMQEHQVFGGPDTTFVIQRKAPDGASNQSVLFKLNPVDKVFNLDVVGGKNSHARIHLGDPEISSNPITTFGNVGIGITSPKEKLEVDGNILATGDVRLAGADCAENFDVIDTAGIEPGVVMVITEEGKLQPSSEAYDRKVAGVLSGGGNYRPGIVLDHQKETSQNRQAIALVGKVYCKVDAEHSPVKVGDLLTTSPTLGHAMKVTDSSRAFGTVIGKALEPLESGQGLIPIIVALQ